jgi:signal transduction histidine kinase
VVSHPRPGYRIAVDCVVGVVCAASTLWLLNQVTLSPSITWFLCPAGTFLGVAFRRRYPVAALAVVIGAAVTGAVVTGALSMGAEPVDIPVIELNITTGQAMIAILLSPIAYVLYTVIVARSWRVSLPAVGAVLAVLALAVVEAAAGQQPTGLPANGTPTGIALGFAIAVITLAGYSVRQNRAYTAALRERAAVSAVTEERLRIARELHDIVAHSMSLIAVQAGAGATEAETALGAILGNSREALHELRLMLGVLRGPDGDARPATLEPASGLADLELLAERTRSAGVTVKLRHEGDLPPLPPGIELSVYRIAQEALTNVIRHAGPGAGCEVIVGCEEGVLSLEVTDDGGDTTQPARPGSATGNGMIGMRERVTLWGGTFRAGPLPRRGFRVAARIPLPIAAVAET